MSRRPAVIGVVPTIVLGLTAVVAGGAVVLSAGREPGYDTVSYPLNALVLGTVGALVTTRRPENRIGWLYLGLGVEAALTELLEGYGYHAGSPGAGVAQWASAWMSFLGIGGTIVVTALFPSGRPADRGSRTALWLAVSGTVLNAVGGAFGHLSDAYFPQRVNPYALEGTAATVVTIAEVVGSACFTVALVLAVVVLVARFRRAHGVERQQLKWVTYSVGLIGIAGVPALFAYDESVPVQVAIAVAVTLFPIAVGAAILRYRLYDIDVLINRTLVYLTLTVLLAAVYLGLVLLAQLALAPVTEGSGVAVAVSTLAVAALFRPARARIQHAVDRRFFRSRYDAPATVDAFAGRLRDELDLTAVATDLTTTIGATLQPAAMSVWVDRRGR